MRQIDRLFTLLILLISFIIISSCNEEGVSPTALSGDFFPLVEGKFRISEVVDTTFDVRGPIVDQYVKKELTGSTEVDLLGRTVYLLETFRAESGDTGSFDFQPDRVWTQYLDPDSTGERFAERIEENIRILVLKFPIFPRVRWNGNLFNNLPSETFRYENLDTTVVINDMAFENCVMVVQQADTNSFINYKFTYEIFAPNIGRIKRFSRVIVNDGPNGEFNPDRSRIFIEEIVDHNY